MAPELYKSTNFKPDVELAWCSEPCLDNAALFLVRDGWLTDDDLSSLSKLDLHYEALVTTVLAFAKVDFPPLQEECPEYSTQKEISPEQVVKLTACVIYFGFDFGLVVQYINDEHILKNTGTQPGSSGIFIH